MLPERQSLRMRDLIEALEFSRSTLWRWFQQCRLPQPIRLGGAGSRVVTWRRSDIEGWLEALGQATKETSQEW